MGAIPTSVLSEHFQDRMEGRRLVDAVFLTFEFDPGFFELEVLPVFLDVQVSHAVAIRRVQLEQALRELHGQVAVYYDSNGLRSGDSGSAKLDFRRFPIRHPTGIFHSKNVLLLVEAAEPDADGEHARSLIVASMSANLTRTGWWENVEVCHTEEVSAGDGSVWRDELVEFLRKLKRRVPPDTQHASVDAILDFLRAVEPRQHRTSGGQLRTHFYAGGESVVDFIDRIAGERVRGMYLEVISPFFDDAPRSRPLDELLVRFVPRETRIFLPRTHEREVRCRPELYKSVKAAPGCAWARLPKDFLRLGRSEEVKERGVHAKVYRFFSQNPKREVLFVGSANLTQAAHQGVGGNVETGFLVEVEPDRRPEFWMDPDARAAVKFQHVAEDARPAACGGSRLSLRFHWDTKRAYAFWDGHHASPVLRVIGRGVDVGELAALPPRAWSELDDSFSFRLQDALGERSILEVQGEGAEPTVVLVQEEGMHQKPGMVLQLTVDDILRYWSLLTADQRAAFLETHAPAASLAGPGADLVTRLRGEAIPRSIFGDFAAMFLAFGSMERSVREAVQSGREREAVYKLFGKKPDSLGTLLDRVAGDPDGDPVKQYLILLCAEQTCTELSKEFPDFWSAHRDEVRDLRTHFAYIATVRERLIAQDPTQMAEFLAWFDPWFKRRARPRGVAA